MEPLQLSLVDRWRGAAALSFDPLMGGRQRIHLDAEAWVDLLRGWVVGQAELLACLRAGMRWRTERRWMYQRRVDVPRLVARVPADGSGHPVLPRLAEALAAAYDTPLPSVSMALYRNGRDSVAWHRDKGLRDRPRSLMATVSVGEPRPFLLRPLGGGRSTSLDLGWGDLLVMGGTCQRTWEHCVPKQARAGPGALRLSIMFRERGDEA